MKEVRIALICDQVQRELSALKAIKSELEKKLKAKVWIIGSVAEAQRIYYLLYLIKPHVVFMSQIQEQEMRNISGYVKNSGGMVCILPVELSYSKTNFYWLFNSRLKYDFLVDLYFLPGNQMYTDILEFTNINKRKLFIVGSPRVDLLLDDNNFLSRKQFLKKFSIPNRKNIFIFSTFYASSVEYIKNEAAFKGNIKKSLRIYSGIEKTKQKYLLVLEDLCAEFPDCNIVFKPHPLEKPDVYRKLNYSNFHLIENETFNNVVRSIDIAVHWNSTVATECWVRKLPTVQFVPIKNFGDLLCDFYPGNKVVEDYKTLVRTLQVYMKSGVEKKYLNFQKKYLENWYFRIDGKSVSRVSAVLTKQIKTRQVKDELRYTRRNFLYPLVLVILEKIIGVYLCRRFLGIFYKNFNWNYAINNYLKFDRNP